MTTMLIIIILALVWAAATVVSYRHPGLRAKGSHLDLLAIGGFALLTVGFFWEVLFLPDYYMPIGGGDLASFLYPVYSFAADSVQNGVLPLWNPYLYGGSPFSPDMQAGLLYPINLLAFLIARPFTYQSIEGLVMIHYFLAGCFTYIFARGLGLKRLPSFGSGIIFAYSGFAVAHLGHYHMLAAATWLPLILFFFHRAITKGSFYALVGAGAFFGIAALAGHTQITLYIGLFLFLYWLWALTRHSAPDVNKKFVAIALPVVGILAVLIAAVLLLPAYQLTGSSVRADLTFTAANGFKSAPLYLIQMFVPHFFGPNLTDYWGIQGNLTEIYAYVGIMPLILAVLAVVFHRKATPLWAFFSLTLILFMLLSFGETTPLFGWIYKIVPGFDKVRAAGRFALLFDFSIAILAGIGLNIILGQLPALWRRVLGRFTFIVGLLLAIGTIIIAPIFYYALLNSQDKVPSIFQRYETALNGLNLTLIFLAIAVALLYALRHKPGQRQLIGAGMILLIIIDLFAGNQGMNPTNEDILANYNHPQIISFLKEHAIGYRVDTRTGIDDIWQPDAPLLEGLEDVMGTYNIMLLADYKTYWENIGSRSSNAYDLLGAKYIVAKKDVVLDWTKYKPVVTDAPKLNVYENTKALPKALVVPNAEVMPRDQMLERIKSTAFEPTKTVLLESPVVSAPAGNGATSGTASDFVRPNPNEITLRTQSDGAAYLLLNEAYYPGWTCYVDGREAAILRADFTFQAVALEPGAHQIRFVFAPRLFTIGLTLSVLATLACLAVLGLALLRRPSEIKVAVPSNSKG